VLLEFGLSWDEIGKLKEQKVIAKQPLPVLCSSRDSGLFASPQQRAQGSQAAARDLCRDQLLPSIG